VTPTHSEGLDADLLASFNPIEEALARRALKRERDKAAEQRQPPRKPTDEELIAAGWARPPPPPPTAAELLQELREIGSGYWTMFSADADAVLQALYERERGLLRRSVTKRWGVRWSIP
jgi:hypothetical protein